MTARVPFIGSAKPIMCDLKRHDIQNYVKFHLVDNNGNHLALSNLFSISYDGFDFYCGIENRNIDFDLTEPGGQIKIIGVDIL